VPGDGALSHHRQAIQVLQKSIGGILAGLRRDAGLSQDRLAKRIGFSRSVVGGAEVGSRFPSRSFWEKCDDALGGGGRLRRAYQPIEAQRAAWEQDRARQAAIKRESVADVGRAKRRPRSLLEECDTSDAAAGGLRLVDAGRNMTSPSGDQREFVAGLGEEAVFLSIDRRAFLTSTGLAVPVAALEIARRRLDLTLVADRTTADPDEWQEIVWEYGHRYNTALPSGLLDDLLVDVVALDGVLRSHAGRPGQSALRGASALLAAFMAQTLANLGDVQHARRWWRTARQAADQSGDLHTILWVRGREIVRALYEQRPLAAILRLLDQAEPASRKAPAAALPQYLCGKSQTLALAGHSAAAERALRQVRENFTNLPPRITRDTQSLFGWSEPNVLFTESFVYSHLGNYSRAERAQSAAVKLYPAAYPRGPAQIELQRALCLVGSGDVTAGVQHAHGVMTKLAAADRIRPVVDLGHKVLDAVPAAARLRGEADTFRDYLASQDSA
jgi:transcriptional regulator with XRE-family HTH domain